MTDRSSVTTDDRWFISSHAYWYGNDYSSIEIFYESSFLFYVDGKGISFGLHRWEWALNDYISQVVCFHREEIATQDKFRITEIHFWWRQERVPVPAPLVCFFTYFPTTSTFHNLSWFL